jgi:methionine biosynthesis protein MetW
MFYFSFTRNPDFKNIKKINYDEYWKTRGFSLRNKLMPRETLCLKWIEPNSKVLDVGCGNSRLLYELKKDKNCEVLGLDVSPLVAESLARVGIPVKVVDIAKTNFDFINDQEFDYIILNEILEHITNPEEVITQIKSKGKKLILSIPNIGFYRYRLGLMFKGRFPTQWIMHPSEHVRYWTHKDFLDWISAMDLELIECQTTAGFRFSKNKWKNLFGHMISYLVKSKNNY